MPQEYLGWLFMSTSNSQIYLEEMEFYVIDYFTKNLVDSHRKYPRQLTCGCDSLVGEKLTAPSPQRETKSKITEIIIKTQRTK